MKTVTVMVPVYNVADYLEACISSIVGQTYPALEILVVDDGSTDNSGNICDDYAKRDKRIKVIHTSNRGVSNARNTALDNALGELLLFVDGDDRIDPRLVSWLVNTMEAKEADIVIGRFIKLTENGDAAYASSSYDEDVLSTEEALRRLLQYKISPSVCNSLVKRKVYEGLRLPNTMECAEDLATAYRLFANANRIAFNSNASYYYVYRSDSLTRKPFSKAHINNVIASEEQLMFVEKYYKSLNDDAKRHVFWQSYSLIRNAEAAGFVDSEFMKKPIENCKAYLKYYMRGEYPIKQKLKTWCYIRFNKVYIALRKLRKAR